MDCCNNERSSGKIIRDKESEYIQTQVIYCDYRRLNKDPEYARTFPRTIEGKEYILKSDSHLWIMPFPREAVSNPGMERLHRMWKSNKAIILR